MNKVIILLIILLSFYQASAQQDFTPESSLGIKFGRTLSQIYFDPVIEQNIVNGFSGGLVFKHFAERIFGVQIELNILQAGWNELLEEPNSYRRNLNYIHFPVLSHFELGKGSTRFFINVGPSLYYLFSEKEKISVSDIALEEEYYRIPADNKLGIGACFGMGILKKFSIGTFQVEGRLNHALSNFYSTKNELNFSSSQYQIVEVNFAYLFDIKKLNKNQSLKIIQ